MALPMPRLAPVMKTVFPESDGMCASSNLDVDFDLDSDRDFDRDVDHDRRADRVV
jgi:hypothetical protein